MGVVELLLLTSSGTTCGSCRSGWRTGSCLTAAPRKPWSRWDKPLSCCRSTRRRRPTLKPFALCAPPSTRHRCVTRPTPRTFARVSQCFHPQFHFGPGRLWKCWRCTPQWSSLKSECRLLSSQLSKWVTGGAVYLLPSFKHLTLWPFSLKSLEHLKGQRGVIRPDDGRQEDLLRHYRLHSLLRRPGDAPGSRQPQSELPDPGLNLLRSPWHSPNLSAKERQTTLSKFKNSHN